MSEQFQNQMSKS